MAEAPLIAIDATSMPPRPAGAATYILNLVRALARADARHAYVVYTRRHSLALFRGLPSRFTVVDIGAASRWQRQLWETAALPVALRRARVSLLHSPHHTTPLLCPCPRVVTVHDVTFFVLPRRYPWPRRLYFRAMTRLAARGAAAVIVPSESVREEFGRHLPPPRRLQVVPEGVDACFRPVQRGDAARVASERYGLPPDYLLSLGTREPGKNRATIFRALRLLLDQGRDLHLAVAGQPGWRSGAEDALLEELRLSGRVHFTGYVAQEDLPSLYGGASAFLFPSLHEGFGLPVLEAMACGVPVVTSDVSALPEVAGGAARLVDPLNAEALAGAVAAILDDPLLAQEMRRAGLERSARFTWDECARRTLEVYRTVLGEE